MALCDIDLVIKLGGSAITKKESFETLNSEALNCAADLIRKCHENKLNIIVVHGAGSFGHHQAKEYQVNHGWKSLTNEGEILVKKGFYLTRQSVTKLHQEVLGALIKKDVPAIGLSVCGSWKTENGSVVCHDLHPVLEVIKNGFIPVLHGDCVLDKVKGCTILSGDTIIKKISEDFSVCRIVFLSSVLGIYDKPPLEFPDAVVLKHVIVDKFGAVSYGREHDLHKPSNTSLSNHDKNVVNVQTTGSNDKSLKRTRTSSSDKEPGNGLDQSKDKIDIVTRIEGKDVTGGMMHKIKCAVDIVKCNQEKTRVFVCKVGSNFSSDICLHGKADDDSQDYGTEIFSSDL